MYSILTKSTSKKSRILSIKVSFLTFVIKEIKSLNILENKSKIIYFLYGLNAERAIPRLLPYSSVQKKNSIF